MGVIAKFTLQLLAVVVILSLGIFFPNALAETLSWLDATLAALAENAEPSGTLKLIFQFAGAGFVVLMAIAVIGIGFTMRQFVSQTFFHWRHIVTAGLIPLLAHAVKWGLGLSWPALLVPVQQLADQLISWFAPATQVTLGLFQARDHLMTIFISLALLLLWSLATFLWRQFRGRKASAPSPSPQLPSGNKWSKIMSIFTKPLNLVRKKVEPIFSKTKNLFRKTGGKTLQAAPQKKSYGKDFEVGPIKWTAIILLLAAMVGYGLSVALMFLGWLTVQFGLLVQNPLAGDVRLLLQVLFTTIFALPHWEQEKVKVQQADGDTETEVDGPWKLKMVEVPAPARGMPLSWIGIMTPIILSSGKYPLFGEWLGFGRVDIESTTIAKDNFLVLSDVTFTVWQSPEKATSSITLQAGNGATVTGNLSFILKGRRRMRWEEAADAGTQLGNRARQELQEIIENFVDTDVKSIQGVMSRLMRGDAMLTCFLPKETAGRKAGSMARDKGGKPIYVFEEDFSGEDAAKATLQKNLHTIGDAGLTAGLGKDADNNYLTTRIKAEKPVTEVVEFLGWDLEEVIYDSVRASEIVEEISNKASSEEKQREIQLASARTAAAAGRELLLTDAERAKLSPLEQAALIDNQRVQQAIDSPNSNVRVIQLMGDSTQRLKDLVAADTLNDKETK